MQQHPFEELLGNELQDNVPTSFYTSKHLYVYISASWCGPCRKFTPTLIQYYDKWQDVMNVIFVSRDNSDAEFKEYWSHMPWGAAKLSQSAHVLSALRVTSIPSLILFSSDGNLISTNGVSYVNRGLPPPPPPRFDILRYISSSVISEYYLLFFSGFRGAASKAAIGELAAWYQHERGVLHVAPSTFQILHIVSDADTYTEDKFNEIAGALPWNVLPWDGNHEEMIVHFNVTAVPEVLCAQADGVVIQRHVDIRHTPKLPWYLPEV